MDNIFRSLCVSKFYTKLMVLSPKPNLNFPNHNALLIAAIGSGFRWKIIHWMRIDDGGGCTFDLFFQMLALIH